MEFLVISSSFINILIMSSHSLLAWKVSVERSISNLMEFLCMLLFCLVALKNLFLPLPYGNLIVMRLGVAPFVFNLFGVLFDLLGLEVHFSTQVQEVFNHCCFKYTYLFYFYYPSEVPIMRIFISSIHNFCRVPSTVSLFFFYSSDSVITTVFFSKSLILALCMIESTFGTLLNSSAQLLHFSTQGFFFFLMVATSLMNIFCSRIVF